MVNFRDMEFSKKTSSLNFPWTEVNSILNQRNRYKMALNLMDNVYTSQYNWI